VTTQQTKFDEICNEPRIYENEKFFVVPDKEPICKNHLLIFSKSGEDSLVDSDFYGALKDVLDWLEAIS